MLTAIFCAIAAFSASAAALTLPDSLRDGVYKASTDADGNEVHEFVSGPWPLDDDLNKTISVREEDLKHEKRWYESQDYGFGVGILNAWCGCGLAMNHGDCDAAVDDLKRQFGNSGWVPRNLAWYSIRGGVVAFACNTNWPTMQVPAPPSVELDAEYLTLSFAAITRICGWYVPGTCTYTDWGTVTFVPAYVGYMNYRPGLDFCSDAPSSRVDHC